MKIKQQLPMFPKDNKNWFLELCNHFDIDTNSPGWPDEFGKKIDFWIKQKQISIPTMSLFSGGGGLDIGFHESGFQALEMVEFEKKYTNTLEENIKNSGPFNACKVNCIDIREYHPPENLKVDFIIGGPPCQTFSAAGRRAAGVLGTDDKRGTLFQEYVRLLKKLKPRAFLFENVYGIIGAQNGDPWRMIQESFDEAGYHLSFRILDTADYGVPQHRERLIILGIKKGLKPYKFPFPTNGPDSANGNDFYSAGQAVSDIEGNYIQEGLGGKYGHLLGQIPPGLNYSFYTQKMGYPQPVFGWRSKFSDFLYKADSKKPVRSIKAQGGKYTGPFSWMNRPFTTDELKRLQTFPDNYTLTGSRKIQIEQIGNSVPPQFARILALSVLQQVFDIELPVKINLMESSHKLGFRSRKRGLTSQYRKIAKDAISKLSLAPIETHSNSYKKLFYLYDDFDFSDTRNKSKQLLTKISASVEANNEMWLLEARTNSGKMLYSIEILPKLNWPLPTKKVILRSDTEDLSVFSGLWKIFENEVMRATGIADLVQLSGYYQYPPKITTSFSPSNGLSNIKEWRFVERIVNQSITTNEKHISYYSDTIGISQEEIFNVFVSLKKYGYEIRNHNTNPQIKKDHYLIPYVFPSLNPRSVQRNKSL